MHVFLLLFALVLPDPSNPALRDELLHCVEQDQAARTAMVEWMRTHGGASAVGANMPPDRLAEWKELTTRVEKIDANNTKWLKTVLDKHGWPTRSLVGEDGANAAWLLVQHADQDVKFQRQCLDQMAKLPKDEIAPQEVAYLTDRVLLAEGKQQLYGTQFITIEGKLQPQPIEDEQNVDTRRAADGLPPLADYAGLLAEQYGPKTK